MRLDVPLVHRCGTLLKTAAGACFAPLQNLQSLCQFGCKRAARGLVAIFSTASSAVGALMRVWCGCSLRSGGLLHGTPFFIFTLRRLCGIGAQQSIFEGCAVKPANDGLHLVGGRCLDKSEALGFLRFVVADHLYGIGHEIFGGQPLLNVIGGDPGREIAKKYGEAHSVSF